MQTKKSIIILSSLFFLTLLLLTTTLISTLTQPTTPPPTNSHSTIWQEIENKTWTWDTFAGGSWTFFEREQGRFVVIQTYGSGVYLADSVIKRVDTHPDYITVDGEKLKLQEGQLSSDTTVLHDQGEISLIDYQGKPLTLEIYLAVQSMSLDGI